MKFVKGANLTGLFWALLPIIYWPGRRFGFELPKAMFLFVLGWGLFILASFEARLVYKKVDKKMLVLLILWVTLLSLGSVRGVAMDKIAWGEVDRWQGLVFYSSLVGLWLALSLWADNILRKKLAKAWMAGIVLTTIFGLFASTPLYAGRIVSSFGQPNFWADYLLVGWVVMVASKKTNLRAKTWLSLVVGVGLTLARSRLDLFIFGFVIAWRWLKNRYLRGLFVILSGLAVFNLVEWGERGSIWLKSLKMISQRPWQGYGLASIGQMLGGVGVAWVDRTHNVFLDMAFYGGGQTTAVFVGILALGMWKAWKNKKRSIFWSLIIWTIVASVHVISTVGWVGLIILLVLAEDRIAEVRLKKLPGWIWLGWFIYMLVLFGVVWSKLGIEGLILV